MVFLGGWGEAGGGLERDTEGVGWCRSVRDSKSPVERIENDRVRCLIGFPLRYEIV